MFTYCQFLQLFAVCTDTNNAAQVDSCRPHRVTPTLEEWLMAFPFWCSLRFYFSPQVCGLPRILLRHGLNLVWGQSWTKDFSLLFLYAWLHDRRLVVRSKSERTGSLEKSSKSLSLFDRTSKCRHLQLAQKQHQTMSIWHEDMRKLDEALRMIKPQLHASSLSRQQQMADRLPLGL